MPYSPNRLLATTATSSLLAIFLMACSTKSTPLDEGDADRQPSIDDMGAPDLDHAVDSADDLDQEYQGDADMIPSHDQGAPLIEDLGFHADAPPDRDEGTSPLPLQGYPCEIDLTHPSPYPEDGAITTTLSGLQPRHGVLLPAPVVHNQDFGISSSHLGPVARDYSNRMVFAPERHVAYYAGGSHGTYRANDVWEYHLASNTWRLRYYPEGGSWGPHKAAIFGLRGWLEDGLELSDEDMQKVENFKAWAKDQVVFERGILTTPKGGPIMPSHQWDGFTYDLHARRIIWRAGAHFHFTPKMIAYLLDLPLAEVEARYDATYSKMWTYDPEQNRWEPYRTQDEELRERVITGMATSAVYIPDRCSTLHYGATPSIYQMWMHDLVSDTWAQLLPNGGRQIMGLAAEGLSPLAEQQMAYSPQSKKIVAVLKGDTFIYDLASESWSPLPHEPMVEHAHDARTVFVHDSKNDVFLLIGRDAPDRIHAFSLDTMHWEEILIQGDPYEPGAYQRPFGYYDPEHNVIVVGNNKHRKMWAFRYQ